MYSAPRVAELQPRIYAAQLRARRWRQLGHALLFTAAIIAVGVVV